MPTELWGDRVHYSDFERRIGGYREGTVGNSSATYSGNMAPMVQKTYRLRARGSRRRANRASIPLPTQIAEESDKTSPSMDTSNMHSLPAITGSELLSSGLVSETLQVDIGVAQFALGDVDTEQDIASQSEMDLSSPSLTDFSNFLDSSGSDDILAPIDPTTPCPLATPSPDAYGWDAEWDRRVEVGDSAAVDANDVSETPPPGLARSKSRKISLLKRVLSVGSNSSVGSLGRRVGAQS